MKTATSWCLAIVCGLGFAHRIAAQDLIVSGARVIVGNGDVIDRGTIVVRRGRISSVSENPVIDPELPILDAEGLTVMPGFIDAHRQVIQGDPDEWMEQAADRLREYVEAGFTTVLSVGDSLERVLELRDRLDSREIPGPRLVVSGPVRLATDNGNAVPEGEIRETVRDLTLMGVDTIDSAVLATRGVGEIEALSVAKDEADQQGLLTLTHIETVEAVMAAVEGGSGYLTRTPWIGELDEEMARDIVEAGRNNAEYGLVMTSTLGAPTVADGNSTGPANARLLWDAGIIFAYGTDTALLPRDALRHELTPLKLVFSNEEIIDILTKSAAFAARRDDALGTLESGKIADIVILDGDPLTDLDDLFNVRVVIRTGRVVIDNR